MEEAQKNYDNSVAVTPEIHWVGYPDDKVDLHCNPYLLFDGDDVVLFDPGSIPHFPIVMRKVMDLVNPDEITTIVVHHQDPDVCGNLTVVADMIGNKDLKIVTHSSNVRLLNYYGIEADFYQVDKNNNELTLASGRVLSFISTPYLHSPFAIVTYDTKTKSLFSSDIFGALSKEWSLFFKGDSFEQMGLWHKVIAPSGAILRECMSRLESLDIERILPQHGSILEGEQVKLAMNYLKDLRCGIDLTKEKE